MKILQDSQPDDEPVIFSLESYRQGKTQPDDHPPEPNDDNDPKANEAYWAGRNLAARLSARRAA